MIITKMKDPQQSRRIRTRKLIIPQDLIITVQIRVDFSDHELRCYAAKMIFWSKDYKKWSLLHKENRWFAQMRCAYAYQSQWWFSTSRIRLACRLLRRARGNSKSVREVTLHRAGIWQQTWILAACLTVTSESEHLLLYNAPAEDKLEIKRSDVDQELDPARSRLHCKDYIYLCTVLGYLPKISSGNLPHLRIAWVLHPMVLDI